VTHDRNCGLSGGTLLFHYRSAGRELGIHTVTSLSSFLSPDSATHWPESWRQGRFVGINYTSQPPRVMSKMKKNAEFSTLRLPGKKLPHAYMSLKANMNIKSVLFWRSKLISLNCGENYHRINLNTIVILWHNLICKCVTDFSNKNVV
jgi:hypothetical protein